MLASRGLPNSDPTAFILFPFCYLIFTVFYAMYGSVLYVTGPFVLALLPVRGLDQLSRTYLVNLMTFQAWGLIYAILQVLMSAVNLSSIDAVLNSNGVLNSFVGSSEMVLLAFYNKHFLALDRFDSIHRQPHCSW